MTHIESYPSVYALGHRAIKDIFSGPVLVQEKVDGSQISFGRFGGELCMRSKGKDLIIDSPEKMFIKAVETAKSLDLHDGFTYRGEYLQSPAHNALSYSRVPNGHIILFDVQKGPAEYVDTWELQAEADRIGLEAVPALFHGKVESLGQFNEFLNLPSVLGGCKVEGVVVKNYNLFTQEKKIAIGKYVSEAFKEVHRLSWKSSNPTQGDIELTLVSRYKAEARWRKAIQHLGEAGRLDRAPSDIGKLITEIPEDIKRECEDEIKEALFAHFWPKIRRGVIAGFPEFYKKELAKAAFNA